MSNDELDGYDLPGPGSVAYYVSKIQEGDPDVEGAKAMLRLFCARARQRKGEFPIPEPLVELLASAFEKYLSGEEVNIAKSLGLKRRGKPPDPEIQKRNDFIAEDVLRLGMKKNTLTGNREQEGAFFIVGQKYDLSESEVRDIYYEHMGEGMTLILLGRLIDSDSA